MAKERNRNKGKGLVGMELPECPVCLETMLAPIFNCQSGHSLCAGCTKNLCPAICPICREPMTQMRNRTLEDIISKAKINCPNKNKGCILTLMAQNMDDHLKECYFRDLECPLGAALGKCSWNGNAKDMLQHMRDRHPEKCFIDVEGDIELNNVCIGEDDRHIFLVKKGKALFILTVKIDTIQKMAYWIMQHIGGKAVAYQYIYEIHIVSKQDSRRKVSFYEHCFHYALKPDEVYRQGKCSMMPLNMLNHFIKDKKLVFQFYIKNISPNSNQKQGAEREGSITEETQGPQKSGGNFAARGGRGNRGQFRGSRARGSGHRSASPFHSGDRKERPM